MSAKLTPEFIDQQLAVHGYLRLSPYVDSKKAFQALCPMKHVVPIIWNSFKQQNARCRVCRYEQQSERQRHSQEFIEQGVAREGYELLSTYTGNQEDIKLSCPKKHIIFMRWNNFDQGARCLICSIKRLGEERRHSQEFVEQAITLEGYELLSPYIDCMKKLEVRCPKKHTVFIAFDSFQRGTRCRVCMYQELADRRRLSQEYVKQELLNEKYEMLSPHINSVTKFHAYCPEKHLISMTWSGFWSGNRCKICVNQKMGRDRRLDIQYVRDYFESKGCKLLSTKYFGVTCPLAYVCNCGRKAVTHFANFQREHRCRGCKSERIAETKRLNAVEFKENIAQFSQNVRA